MIQNHTKSFSEWMRILLTAFFSRFRIILLAPILCGLVTALICSALPSVYSGGFSILIKTPEVDKTTLEEGTSVVLRPGVIMENIISDEIYLLKSHELFRDVARTIKSVDALKTSYLQTVDVPDWLSGCFDWVQSNVKSLLKKYFPKKALKESSVSPSEALASAIEGMTKVEQQKGSDVIEVHIKHHNPRLIKEILIAYLQAYDNLRDAVWFNKTAPDFFKGQSETYYMKWQELLDKLLVLKEEHDLMEPVQEKGKLQGMLLNYNSEFINLKATISELKIQTETLKSLSSGEALTFMPERIEVDRLFNEIKTMIGLVKAERSKLLRNFNEKSSEVLKIDYQLTDLYTQYKGLLMGFFKNKLNRNKIRLDSLSAVMNETKGRLLRLERHGQQISILEEKAELYRKQYSEHLKRSMNANLQKELRKTAATVKVISTPFVYTVPVWPKKKMLVVLAVLLGFLLTMLCTVVAQLMKDSFSLPEEISQELNLPVLASFPLKRNIAELGSVQRKIYLLPSSMARSHSHRRLLTSIGVIIAALLISWIWCLKPFVSQDEKKDAPMVRKAIETGKDLRKRPVNKSTAKEAKHGQLAKAGLLALNSFLQRREAVVSTKITEKPELFLTPKKKCQKENIIETQEKRTNIKPIRCMPDQDAVPLTPSKRKSRNIAESRDQKAHFFESKPLAKEKLYIVRLGLYRIKQNALDMYEGMKEGYDVTIKRVNNPKIGRVYAVQLKPVTDVIEARSLISQIKRQKGLTAVILKRFVYEEESPRPFFLFAGNR